MTNRWSLYIFGSVGQTSRSVIRFKDSSFSGCIMLQPHGTLIFFLFDINHALYFSPLLHVHFNECHTLTKIKYILLFSLWTHNWRTIMQTINNVQYFLFNKVTFEKANKHFTGNDNLITSLQMLLLFILCFLVVFNQTYTFIILADYSSRGYSLFSIYLNTKYDF